MTMPGLWRTMPMMTAFAACLTLSHAAQAATVRCDVAGYTVDKDPKGLNVRAGPGRRYKVIGRIPKLKPTALVTITGSKNGWLRLSKAEDFNQPKPKILFAGTGWVYGRLIATNTRGYETRGAVLRSRPKQGARAVAKVPTETEVLFAGCNGRWAKVIWRRKTGWLASKDQCGLNTTTCP